MSERVQRGERRLQAGRENRLHRHMVAGENQQDVRQMIVRQYIEWQRLQKQAC